MFTHAHTACLKRRSQEVGEGDEDIARHRWSVTELLYTRCQWGF